MSEAYFPFHSLGYHCNPFRALTDREWMELALMPDAIEAVLPLRGHLQILGDKGHGKTSALLALTGRLSHAGRPAVYEHLEIGQDYYRTRPSPGQVLLLDEAQRLRRGERRRLLRQASTTQLVLASHEDYAPVFRKSGLPLTSVRLDLQPPGHAAAVIAGRLERFRLSGSGAAQVKPEAVDWLVRRYGADIRLMENALYEAFQHLCGKGAGAAVGLDEIQAAAQLTDG